jgi:dihydropteroate synthase
MLTTPPLLAESKKPFLIMGVVNVTPDSFSDGGLFNDPPKAFEHALKLVEHGADIIDIGAESTRPGHTEIDADTEWRRLEPVIKLLRQRNIAIKISIDTRKSQTMLRAAELGIDMINDVEGGKDLLVLKKLGYGFPYLSYLAMHNCAEPFNEEYVATKVSELEACGFQRKKIWVDPGIGFAKTDELSWKALKASIELSQNYNIAVGISRKSFMGRWLDIKEPMDRDPATKGLEAGLVLSGVKMIRTHEVGPLQELRKLL